MEFAETSVNRLARQLASAHDIHLWTGARLFAQINMALFDTYVAVWDSKYEYNHWRPYTAVREADADGNPRTTPVPQWESLRPAPPHPETYRPILRGVRCPSESSRRIQGESRVHDGVGGRAARNAARRTRAVDPARTARRAARAAPR